MTKEFCFQITNFDLALLLLIEMGMQVYVFYILSLVILSACERWQFIFGFFKKWNEKGCTFSGRLALLIFDIDLSEIPMEMMCALLTLSQMTRLKE